MELHCLRVEFYDGRTEYGLGCGLKLWEIRPIPIIETNHYVVKMNADKVHLCRSNGTYVRLLAAGAKFAIVQGDEVHVTMANNQVKIYGINGTRRRTI